MYKAPLKSPKSDLHHQQILIEPSRCQFEAISKLRQDSFQCVLADFEKANLVTHYNPR